MSDEKKDPDPIEDVREGFGLLFRAAKKALDKLPKKEIESAITVSAREVERAAKNVAHSVESRIQTWQKKDTPSSAPPPVEGDAPVAAAETPPEAAAAPLSEETAPAEKPAEPSGVAPAAAAFAAPVAADKPAEAPAAAEKPAEPKPDPAP